MEMDDDIALMARGFYGYGRWDAPYWFIGPEQGGDNNGLRARAFVKLAEEGLCDCKEFHKEIHENRWHRENPALVPTWRRLILLLKVFLNDSTTEDLLNKERCRALLRDYQRDHWGMETGETCVIDLSGLSAKNSRVGAGYKAIKEGHLGERIQTIRGRMHRGSKPKIVLMYGFSEKESWARIAGTPFIPHGVKKTDNTVFAFAQHPSAHNQDDSYWVRLGERLREAAQL
jgi:hypothetical protein